MNSNLDWIFSVNNTKHIGIDFIWFEDIAQKLKFWENTSLNVVCPQWRHLNRTQKDVTVCVPPPGAKTCLKTVLDFIWVRDYKIVDDNSRNLKKDLKKEWVIVIGYINDFWDFNIQSINDHFNPWDGYISIYSFKWRNNLPYVLFYDKEKPLNADWLISSIKEQQNKTLTVIN